MKQCACGTPIPSDFTTCSSRCTERLTSTTEQPRASDDRVYDTIPDGVVGVTAEVVAQALNTTAANVLQWKYAGKVPHYQLGPRTVRFDLAAVKKARGIETVAAPVETQAPIRETKVVEVGALLQLESWRQRALQAAKQSFRDVMLEGADEAKARGDWATQARFLEDFIFFEDGLEIVYRGRPA